MFNTYKDRSLKMLNNAKKFSVKENFENLKGVIFVAKLCLVIVLIASIYIVARGSTKTTFTSTQQKETFGQNQNLALITKTKNQPTPKLLSIPNIEVSAPFEILGLNANQTIEVPINPKSVGWFIYGAKPGEIGALIIVGHLDAPKKEAGVFVNLNKLKPGDEITVKLSNNSLVTYRVDSLSIFPQNNFPTEKVYGKLDYAGIRLITCSGNYNKKAGHYTDNLVVFGTKIQ
jgi:LPXTG-site transpeptidase (sortase) family protein